MTDRRSRLLTTKQFAIVAGITRQKGHSALRRCSGGGAWRGHRLAVHIEHGCGGKGGQQYRVRLDSLPAEFQERAIAIWPGLAGVPAPVETTGRALAPAPGRDQARPRGRRTDKGKRRVYVSRKWDNTVPFDDDTRQRIADATARDVRSIWATDARGWRHVGRLALPQLMKTTRAAGFAGTDDELRAICTLPRGFIDRERAPGLAVARHDKDAKAFFDRQPRVRRDWSQVRPGEVMIGDVHPFDILYRRDDGSTATPKGIAWMDGASRYTILHPVFLEKGEGIRMEHVAASFANMVAETGTMPGRLYLDNGGEYNWAEFAEAAMKLVERPGVPLLGINDRDARRIVKALPYNAPAKPIEPWFARLEDAMRDLPGHIGGDRMKKKTHNVGREPKPFPGTQAELWQEIRLRCDYVNNTPMQVLGGRTPAQVFAERERHEIDLIDLETAFSKPKVVTLRQGEFRFNNVYYGHDALDARPDLTKVVAFIPIFGDRERIAVETPDGTFLCHAEPRRYFHPLDTAGAKESARRKALARQGVRALKETVYPVHVSVRMDAYIALNPAPPAREPAAVFGLAGEKKRAADDRRRLAAKGPRGDPSGESTPNYFGLLREKERKRGTK